MVVLTCIEGFGARCDGAWESNIGPEEWWWMLWQNPTIILEDVGVKYGRADEALDKINKSLENAIPWEEILMSGLNKEDEFRDS